MPGRERECKMTEYIVEIIKNGFYGWRRNPVIGVPYLAATVLSMILIAIPFILLIVLVFQKMYAPALLSDFDNPLGLFSPAMLMVFIASFVLCAVLLVFIRAFFESAALSMCVKVAAGGETGLSDIIPYGKKKAVPIFIAWVLIMILALLPAAALFVLAIALFQVRIYSVWAFFVIGGFAFYLLYTAVLLFLSTPVSSAIVAGNMGALDSIRAGFRFSLKNRLRVFFLYATFYNLMWVMGMVYNTLTGPFYLFGLVLPGANIALQLIFMVIYLLVLEMTVVPLYALWIMWTYLDATGAELKRYPARSSRQEKQERRGISPEVYIRPPL